LGAKEVAEAEVIEDMILIRAFEARTEASNIICKRIEFKRNKKIIFSDNLLFCIVYPLFFLL
jgi:hypothetical protein